MTPLPHIKRLYPLLRSNFPHPENFPPLIRTIIINIISSTSTLPPTHTMCKKRGRRHKNPGKAINNETRRRRIEIFMVVVVDRIFTFDCRCCHYHYFFPLESGLICKNSSQANIRAEIGPPLNILALKKSNTRAHSNGLEN